MAVNNTSPSKKKYYEVYKQTHKREKNKIRKILKYLRKHPNDSLAQRRLAELQALYK